jgi:hypothetical protein
MWSQHHKTQHIQTYQSYAQQHFRCFGRRKTRRKCEQGLKADLLHTDLWTSTSPKLVFKLLRCQLRCQPIFCRAGILRYLRLLILYRKCRKYSYGHINTIIISSDIRCTKLRHRYFCTAAKLVARFFFEIRSSSFVLKASSWAYVLCKICILRHF